MIIILFLITSNSQKINKKIISIFSNNKKWFKYKEDQLIHKKQIKINILSNILFFSIQRIDRFLKKNESEIKTD